MSELILNELHLGARRSYARIGLAVGLSPEAVRQRIHRMIESGIVRIVAVAHPKLLGPRRHAIIGIRCSGDASEAATQLAAIPSIVRVALTAGTFDILAEVVYEDTCELLAILNGGIRGIHGVASTQTLECLKVVKHAVRTRPTPGASSRTCARSRD